MENKKSGKKINNQTGIWKGQNTTSSTSFAWAQIRGVNFVSFIFFEPGYW